jgi:hypothetical protein
MERVGGRRFIRIELRDQRCLPEAGDDPEARPLQAPTQPTTDRRKTHGERLVQSNEKAHKASVHHPSSRHSLNVSTIDPF